MDNKPKIPSQFSVMGKTYTVKIIPKEEWVDEGNWGSLDPSTCEVHLLRNPNPLVIEQTFYHELVHAILIAMSHKCNTNEKFVDNFGGLLHQAIKSSK